MTATLQDLYDDIKELIHQKFETKTEEDTTLPEIIESYFNYNQGELNIDMPHMKLIVTGSSFETYSSTPFTYTGEIFVDWGDDTGLIEYNGGKLSHTFSDGLNSHNVKIYGNITSLGIYCFYGCTGLTSITIPSSITSLGKNCFDGCTGLTSITIPLSVTNLGNLCFANCTSLTAIAIPSSITSLGQLCFDSCTNLTSILLNWNTSTNILPYDSSLIIDTSSSLKFSIPNGTTSLYTAKNYPSDKLVERD